MGPHTKKSLAAVTVLFALGIASQASAQSVSTVTGPKQMGAVDLSGCTALNIISAMRITCNGNGECGNGGTRPITELEFGDQTLLFEGRSRCPHYFEIGPSEATGFLYPRIWGCYESLPQGLESYQTNDIVCAAALRRMPRGRGFYTGWHPGGYELDLNNLCTQGPSGSEYSPNNYCVAGTREELSRASGWVYCRKI